MKFPRFFLLLFTFFPGAQNLIAQELDLGIMGPQPTFPIRSIVQTAVFTPFETDGATAESSQLPPWDIDCYPEPARTWEPCTCALGCRECRDCSRCQCPPPEAPCIDCPHVSTLKPYSNLHIFGLLKADMLFNSSRPVSSGVPFFLAPRLPLEENDGTLSIHGRNSLLGVAITGPRIGAFQSAGVATAFFYNDNVIVDRYGILPLNVWGELRNEDWRFAAGLQFDVFSPRTPNMLVWSILSASGNTGNNFRGQFRIERFFHPAENVRWTIQTALSEPLPTSISPDFLSEDNGWPNVEGRLALGIGVPRGTGPLAGQPFELGISGVGGQLRTVPVFSPDVIANVWGVGGDFHWRFSDCMGIRGEIYSGQGLGTYNGAVLQNINLDTLQSIRSNGGWGELFCYWTPCLHSHLGYGIDDPLDRDLTDTQRSRNETYFGNLLWNVTKTFRLGFEFTWRETAYHTLTDNEGAGFHTQVQWSF